MDNQKDDSVKLFNRKIIKKVTLRAIIEFVLVAALLSAAGLPASRSPMIWR